MKPYIAITGFTSPEQIAALEIPRIEGRDIMLGVLVSSKSLARSRAGEDTKKPRYPSLNKAFSVAKAIDEIGRDDVKAAFHYNSREALEEIANDLHVIAKSPRIDAIQLNLGDPLLVKRAVTAMQKEAGHWAAGIYEKVDIIFQANSAMLARFSMGELLSFFEALRPPDRKAHVLLDPSGGQGVVIDLQAPNVKIAWDETRRFPDFVLGIAGGLKPETVGDIFKAYPASSVDIETGVRTAGDQMSVPLANEYLKNASEALRSAT